MGCSAKCARFGAAFRQSSLRSYLMSHATSESHARLRDDGAQPHAQAVTSASVPAESKLRGHLGTFELAFTALAFNAPLLVVGGFIPVITGAGNGLGAPVAFLAIGVLLLVFSAGLNAMAT